MIAGFDPTSLCYSLVERGAAAIITDFRQDGDGLTRMLVLDRGLTPASTGALSQRLIDIETYRTLAMLGLPLALTLSGRARRIEDRLAQTTLEMKAVETRDSQTLLADLTELAAELEADAASSLYRFGASRAYDGIVTERLGALEEEPVQGFDTWAGFLQRRMAPAMRTCRSVEERMANLSRKLTRTTTLLRTWVDVDVEKQNRDLLASMNNRARLQLRLQPGALVALAFAGALRAALDNLGDPGEFEPDRGPALGEALEIAVGQLPLGAGFHSAHGMN